MLMAKIVYGPLISEARNGLGPVTWRTVRKDPSRPAPPLNVFAGGIVFSRGVHGDYVRGRIEPPYSNTQRQANVRDALTQAVHAWQTMISDTQRAAWDVFANTYSSISRTSHRRSNLGYTAFMRVNATQFTYGGLPLLDPPPDQDVTEISGFAILVNTATPASLLLTMNDAPFPPGQPVAFFASPPVSAGFRYPFKYISYIGIHEPTTSWPQDIAAEYTSVWGPQVPGKRIGIQCCRWNPRNAALSQRQSTTSITT